jgi:predicted dehydrogenase
MMDEVIFIKSLIADICPEVIDWKEYLERDDLRVAIIGFGKMGLLHSCILNILIPSAVKCIVDKSFLITFGASRVIKLVKTYRDIGKMLKKVEPEIVYVTTPANSHYPVLRCLIKHGVKCIFVEKPPTVNCKLLEELISIKKADQCIMVGFQKRYALPFRHVKVLIDHGVMGDLQSVHAYIKSGDVQGPTARFDKLGRGVLLDLGIHVIDLLVWFFKIKQIVYVEAKSIYTKVDDNFKAELITENNAKVLVEATWTESEYRMPETCIKIQGSLGTISVTEDYLKVKTEIEHPLINNRKEIILYKPHYYQGILPVNLADPEYTIENIHFLKSIHENKSPLTSIESSLETMKLIDELYDKSGRKYITA